MNRSHRWRRGLRLLLVILVAAPAATALTSARASTPAPSDTGLSIVAKGAVAADASGSFEPAVTRAANGNLLVAYPTSTDAGTGGELRLARSTDGGATWSEPQTLYTPHIFTGGSVAISVGMTTLPDGTILLPFNEGVNLSPYRNRDSRLFVARSTDNGHTWTDLDTPVKFPTSVREQWSYGKILRLAGGVLVLPVWGTKELVPDWQKNPMPWRSAVLRSFDGGRTWSQYSTIAFDPNVPASGSTPSGPNETSVEQLRDGRLLAVVRYQSPDGGARSYVAYSADQGDTWSAPQRSTIPVQSPSLTTAPCGGGSGKLILGYRNQVAPYAGAPALSVSYDDGVTWQGKTLLQDPEGTAPGGYVGSYPAFTDLGDGRFMVVFMEKTGSKAYRVAYDIVRNATEEDCAGAAEAVRAHNAEQPTVFVQRGGRDSWPFGYALNTASYPASTKVADLSRAVADGVVCNGSGVQIRRGTRVLDPAETLAANGVRSGDVLTVSAVPPGSGQVVAGLRDHDVNPDDAAIGMWSDECDYRVALDYRDRSLGLHLRVPSGKVVSSIALRDSDGSTRLTAADYTLWAGSDDHTFTQVTGWSLGTTTGADGRLVQTFSGLRLTQPYLKIHTRYGDQAFTFVLNSLRDDVTVTFADR